MSGDYTALYLANSGDALEVAGAALAKAEGLWS